MQAPTPTVKERAAWDLFTKLVQEIPGKEGLSPIAAQELERLVTKGNPLAVQFKEKLSQASYRPRAPGEAGVSPPPARRIKNIVWKEQ